MAFEQCFEDATLMQSSSSYGEEKSKLGRWESISNSTTDSSCGFDCSICLELVKDPVVTLCGHLFCWPCIYKWLQFHNTTQQNRTDRQHQCPVCKSQISDTTLVPLYGKGQPINPTKNREAPIPDRPPGPASHNRYYQSRMGDYGASIAVPTTDMFNPSTGVFGEMVYARAFGNTITNVYVYPNSYNLFGSSSPGIRRHIMKANKSLNRMCIFFYCCLILCLLLF